MPYPRFRQLDVIWDLPEGCAEWAHVEATLLALEPFLADLGFVDRFVFYATREEEKLAIDGAERTVVYQIGDKTHEVPAYINDVFMVFKNYVPIYPPPDALRVVPLGCAERTPTLPVQEMQDRAIDLFFAGRSDHRVDFTSALDRLYPQNARGPEIRIENTASLTPENYAHHLAQTKIALCPRGDSHETYRIFEAMRAGCIVIAARQLSTWYNEGWPVIEINDWNELGIIADDLLNDDVRLQDVSAKTRLWWEEHCSEEAVAQYMARELSLSLMKQSI